MDDLVQWLTAQLDEDERIARAATPGPWRDHDTHLGQYGYAATVLSGKDNDTDLRAWLPSMSNEPWDEARNVWADAAHIAEHDPARVLREIDANRQLLGLHHAQLIEVINADREERSGYWCAECDLEEFPCRTLRLLALPYADRPGYREEWRHEREPPIT